MTGQVHTLEDFLVHLSTCMKPRLVPADQLHVSHGRAFGFCGATAAMWMDVGSHLPVVDAQGSGCPMRWGVCATQSVLPLDILTRQASWIAMLNISFRVVSSPVFDVALPSLLEAIIGCCREEQ